MKLHKDRFTELVGSNVKKIQQLELAVYNARFNASLSAQIYDELMKVDFNINTKKQMTELISNITTFTSEEKEYVDKNLRYVVDNVWSFLV